MSATALRQSAYVVSSSGVANCQRSSTGPSPGRRLATTDPVTVRAGAVSFSAATGTTWSLLSRGVPGLTATESGPTRRTASFSDLSLADGAGPCAPWKGDHQISQASTATAARTATTSWDRCQTQPHQAGRPGRACGGWLSGRG